MGTGSDNQSQNCVQTEFSSLISTFAKKLKAKLISNDLPVKEKTNTIYVLVNYLKFLRFKLIFKSTSKTLLGRRQIKSTSITIWDDEKSQIEQKIL